MHCIFVYPVIKQAEQLDGGYTGRQIHGKATVNWFVAGSLVLIKASDIASLYQLWPLVLHSFKDELYKRCSAR